MTKVSTKKRRWPPLGYPSVLLAERGCGLIAAAKPDDVHLTIPARLHNLGLRKAAALLQVFDIATKAADWMLRHIQRHEPLRLFAPYRKRNSTSYNTDAIAEEISRRYRELIRSRFTMNGSVFGGLCSHLASNISGWLQKMTEAEQKGFLRRYAECSEFMVTFGKHRGKALKELSRDALFGFAFLQPTREQLERQLRYVDVLVNDHPEEIPLRDEAEAYRVENGRRRGDALGSMRPETWRRLRLLAQRDLDRLEQIENVRTHAKDFLRYTPDSFPRTKSRVIISARRRQEFVGQFREALDAYGALPEMDDEEFAASLALNERALFRELQRKVYAATKQLRYVTLQWDRADGALRSRDVALLFEPTKRRYLFLAHVLHNESHHKRALTVHGDLVDVNNPDVSLKGREKPSIANLYELEFSQHQLHLLNRARREVDAWKDKGKSSGAVRSAKLQAHYDDECQEWWFEVLLSIGFKPEQYQLPQRVVGVHVNPRRGWFVSILGLDGAVVEQFQLDELRVAQLLENDDPQAQARLKPSQRTAKEQSHRYADAITALCVKHNAVCAYENIGYQRAEPGPNQLKGAEDNSRTIFTHLKYKLPLVEIAPPLDVRGVAPSSDCGRCGHRHGARPVKDGRFACQACGHGEPVGFNAAREVARRGLWVLAAKKPPRPKKSKTDVHKTATT